MTTTLKRFNKHLKMITQVVSQVEEEYRAGKAVEKDWPLEIFEARQQILDAYAHLTRVESEIEASYARRLESGEALQIVIDRLRDVMTVMGDEGQNLAFLQATDKPNLQVFVIFLLKFPEVFQEVLEEMNRKDFDTIAGVIDRARGNRK